MTPYTLFLKAGVRKITLAKIIRAMMSWEIKQGNTKHMDNISEGRERDSKHGLINSQVTPSIAPKSIYQYTFSSSLIPSNMGINYTTNFEGVSFALCSWNFAK